MQRMLSHGSRCRNRTKENEMILKIMKLLLKIETWALNKCIDKDTLEYEDYLYSIKKHEKEIERISRESKM